MLFRCFVGVFAIQVLALSTGFISAQTQAPTAGPARNIDVIAPRWFEILEAACAAGTVRRCGVPAKVGTRGDVADNSDGLEAIRVVKERFAGHILTCGDSTFVYGGLSGLEIYQLRGAYFHAVDHLSRGDKLNGWEWNGNVSLSTGDIFIRYIDPEPRTLFPGYVDPTPVRLSSWVESIGRLPDFDTSVKKRDGKWTINWPADFIISKRQIDATCDQLAFLWR